MGGGILPLAIKGNKLYLLFGKEVEDGKWSDFGGGKEGSESPLRTAIREGCEELDGFLGCESALKKLVTRDMVVKLKHEQYHTYVFRIPYDEILPDYFRNHHIFIKKHLPHLIRKNGLFEKSEIKWFSIEEIKHAKSQFRPFYKKILNLLLENHEAILDDAKTVNV